MVAAASAPPQPPQTSRNLRAVSSRDSLPRINNVPTCGAYRGGGGKTPPLYSSLPLPPPLLRTPPHLIETLGGSGPSNLHSGMPLLHHLTTTFGGQASECLYPGSVFRRHLPVSFRHRQVRKSTGLRTPAPPLPLHREFLGIWILGSSFFRSIFSSYAGVLASLPSLPMGTPSAPLIREKCVLRLPVTTPPRPAACSSRVAPTTAAPRWTRRPRFSASGRSSIRPWFGGRSCL